MMAPLIEHPCGVQDDRDPDERLKVIQQLEDERQRNVATIAPHFCFNRGREADRTPATIVKGLGGVIAEEEDS